MKITAKKVNRGFKIKITETNHSNKDNTGAILGRTLQHIANQYINGERKYAVLQDVNGRDKFMVNYSFDGKLNIKGSEFIRCAGSNGINNDDDFHYNKTDVTRKKDVVCLKYQLVN